MGCCVAGGDPAARRGRPGPGHGPGEDRPHRVLTAGTSLAYIIGYRELTRVARIIAEREFRAFEVFTFIAVVYFVCTYTMSLAARRLERRLGPA